MKRARKARKQTPKQITTKNWEKQLILKLRECHKKNIEVKAKKMVRKIDAVKRSMDIRSRKYKVESKVTIEELRNLAHDAYGTPCKYTGRLLTLESMVFDHIIPISKGGPSNIENIQVISRFANNMKSNLMEEDFLILLEWLKTVPETLSKNVSVRLAGGIGC